MAKEEKKKKKDLPKAVNKGNYVDDGRFDKGFVWQEKRGKLIRRSLGNKPGLLNKPKNPLHGETKGQIYGDLHPKKCLFIKHYLITGQAKKAAKLAGYTYDRKGFKLLKDPEVAAIIRQEQLKRMERFEITADMVLQEIAAVAFANLADVVDWSSSGITLKNSKDLPLLVKKAVQEVSETVSGKSTTTKVKMHDKMLALEKLMKNLGLYPKDGDSNKDKAADPLKTLFEAVLSSRQKLGHDVPLPEPEEEPEEDEEEEDESDEDSDDEDDDDEDSDDDDEDDD